jgi:AraC-like DNA-binding protein
MRQKRTIARGKEEIEKIINESGMNYTLINNRIFDDLYEQQKKSIPYYKSRDEVENVDITELDLVTYIMLQFMMINKFTLNYEEMARFIGCSSKQLKHSLKKMAGIKVKGNARYSPDLGKTLKAEFEDRYMITNKEHKAFNPRSKKSVKTQHYYTNFIPDHKDLEVENKKPKPINFFMVTLDDFKLLTDGVLERNEFITYLFLLRINKFKSTKPFYISISKIADRLNYRLPETVDKHIEKIKSITIDGSPLVEEQRPMNYDLQIMKGEEPSAYYQTTYNLSKMLEMSSDKSEVSFTKEEMSSEKKEMDLWEEEMSSEEMEMAFKEMEMSS